MTTAAPVPSTLSSPEVRAVILNFLTIENVETLQLAFALGGTLSNVTMHAHKGLVPSPAVHGVPPIPTESTRMDATSLANMATFLVPYAPYLVAGGKGLAGEVGKRIGSAGWELAKQMWARVQDALLQRVDAQEAIETLQGAPEDGEASVVLARALRKLLEKDPALAAQLAELFEANREVIQKVYGERSHFKDVEQEAAAGTRSLQLVGGPDSTFEGIKQKVTKH